MDPPEGPDPQDSSSKDQQQQPVRNNGPPMPGSSLAPPVEETGASFAARSRSVSPASSSRMFPAATPAAQSETNTEYFPTLDTSSSLPPSSPIPVISRLRSSSNRSSNRSAESDPLEPLRQPSIRIRRRRSSTRSSDNVLADEPGAEPSNRPRSNSQPERGKQSQDAAGRARYSRRAPTQMAMPRLTEEGARPTMEDLGIVDQPPPPAHSRPVSAVNADGEPIDLEAEGEDGGQGLRRMRTWSRIFRPRGQTIRSQDSERTSNDRASSDRPPSRINQEEYDERLVDYLDTVDPEVQTLSTLTNVQNSLFVPDLGRWVNRRPTYTLSESDYHPPADARPPPLQPPAPDQQQQQEEGQEEKQERPRPASVATQQSLDRIHEEGGGDEAEGIDPMSSVIRPDLHRSNTITSRLTDSHYAALPHGATLEGWTEEEKLELDDHVRHMMHSRRSKFKRTMKGFGQYVRQPLGFLVTLYATLITLFGLAWVLFLIGWIYVGEKQVYTIHVIDSVLVALFAIMGDGLAPFRAVDTYHMIFIIHYARKVRRRLRRKDKEEKEEEEKKCVEADVERQMAGEEPLGPQRDPEAASVHSHNPHTMRNNIMDTEDTKSGIEAYESAPLSFAQQKKLYHHQKKLARSHSFYKPQETATHYAFPLKYLMAVVILLDCHSCLQISLGACTWGIDYHTRPKAITSVILSISITCNITAGILISMGDHRTRKKDVWNLMTRQELTSDAIKEIEHKRSHSTKQDKTGESDLDTDPSGSDRKISTSSLADKLAGKHKDKKKEKST